ncbi:LOW QUALITY PROTEIN: hypothetical protein MXB_2705 [Myxobolus squamalis]|nr:LOW QUALITY PROTEIN: hypothetical protein MXB_2705 [Myxobolus squamalis]
MHIITSNIKIDVLQHVHKLVVLSKYSWMHTTITVDFEKYLLNFFKHEFLEYRMIGCYFHLKPELHTKMKQI